MPVWFQNQLMRAFFQKDLNQILMLNQFWYYYLQCIRKSSNTFIETSTTTSSK